MISDKPKVFIKAAAGVIFKEVEGRRFILLIQRAKDDHWPLHYEFPRGKCDKPIGEDIIKCLKREVKEETGLDITPVKYIDKFTYLADRGERKTTCYNFLCKMDDPDQKIKLSKEHEDYKFIGEVGEAGLLVMPEQRQTIEKALNTDRSLTMDPDNSFTSKDKIEEYLNYLNEQTSLITKSNLNTSLMKKLLDADGKSEREFKVGMVIEVDNIMQSGYSYELSEQIGKNFASNFKPDLTPKQMLERGVFEGKYFNDQILEFPKEWFLGALRKGKLSPQGSNPKVNYMEVRSRQSLGVWKRNGWIYGDDLRGWAEWYFRYYLGRRDSSVDRKQISRHNGIKRFIGALKKNCKQGEMTCRPVMRQLLTNWSYDATRY